MTENQPTPPLDDELLSAYVDGELTDDERAQVEARLANDPQARQLVDELRTLSQQIQSLPAESIGEDLRATIMQRAEREMLIGGQAEKVLPKREASTSRKWTWIALAAAATLLVNLMLPSIQQEEQPLASAKPVQAATTDDVMTAEADADRAEPEGIAAGEESLVADESNDAERAEAFADKPMPSEPAAAGAASDVQPRMLASSAPAPSAGVASRSSNMSLPEQESPTAAIVDLSSLTCEVHISLGDGQKSAEQVDRYLVKNQIALPASTDESATSEAVTRAENSRTYGVDEGIEDSAQLILVEAPLKNIEGTLEDCSIDAFNCPTIRVVDKRKQQTPPVEQLLKWQRGPDEARFDEVVEQFALQQQSRLPQNQLNFRQATNLADRARVQQRKAVAVQSKQLALQPKAAELAEEDEPPVRVLFVLQQAADLRKPLKVKSEVAPSEKR